MKKYLWLLASVFLLLTACGTKAPDPSLYQSLCMVGSSYYGVDLSGNVYQISWDGSASLFAKLPTTQWVADESLCHIYYWKQKTIYALDTASGNATELCQLSDCQELEYALEGYLLYRSSDDEGDWTHCAIDLTTLEVQEYLEDPEGYSSWVLCSGNSTVYMVNRRNQEVMGVMIDAWDLTTGAVTHLVPERPISETPSTGILVGDELYYITSTGVMYSVSISAPGERETHLFTDLGVCNESLLTQCGDDLYITGFYDGATTIYRYDPDADQVTAVGRFEDGVVKSFVTDGSRYGAACRSGVDYHTVWGDLATEVPLDGEA